MKYLLDTNTLSALATYRSPPMNKKFIALDRQHLCTCDVVWHEVQFGLAANELIASKLRSIYDMLFDGMEIVATTRSVWMRAALVRAQLKRLGTPIGPYDLLIAATALEHGLIVVTNNLTEFERVQGLSCENWQV